MAAEAAPVIVVTRGIQIFKMRIILENEAERANWLSKATCIYEADQTMRNPRPRHRLLEYSICVKRLCFVTERYARKLQSPDKKSVQGVSVIHSNAIGQRFLARPSFSSDDRTRPANIMLRDIHQFGHFHHPASQP